MGKKIDLELYLKHELSSWIDNHYRPLDYGVWLIKKLAVLYSELQDIYNFENLKQIYELLHSEYRHRKIVDELGQYLSDLEDFSFSQSLSVESVFSELMENDMLDIDHPEEFFQKALDITSYTCGFLSDEYLTILEYYVQIMLKMEKHFQMIDFIDSLIDRVEDENLGDEMLFILMGYKVSLYLGIDMDGAYQIEKERIKLCEQFLSANGDAEILANEVSTFMQILSLHNCKEDFFSLLNFYFHGNTFSDEELLSLLNGVCLSFDMHQYEQEIEAVILPCVEKICSRSGNNVDLYLTARRYLINFYSLTHDWNKVKHYLDEDLATTEAFYGTKSQEYRILIDSALSMSVENEEGDESLKYIRLIRKNDWAKDDKPYSCVLQLYEAMAYCSKCEYKKAKKMGLLAMFMLMLLSDEEQSSHWVEALDVVARCEIAEGDIEGAQRHYENILEESLRVFGPDDPFVLMASDCLDSLQA